MSFDFPGKWCKTTFYTGSPGTKIRGSAAVMSGLCAMRAREEKTAGGGETGLQPVWV
jgi:hypothetical protein